MGVRALNSGVGGSSPSPPTVDCFLIVHSQNLDVYLLPYRLLEGLQGWVLFRASIKNEDFFNERLVFRLGNRP